MVEFISLIKKIREEILELEKKEEFRSKYLGSEIKVGNETHFVNFSYLKKKFLQILSNGCKYYRNDYNYKIGESNLMKNIQDKVTDES